jgi:hypothetical protein
LAAEKVTKHQHHSSTLSSSTRQFVPTEGHEMKKEKELYERRKAETERRYQ